MSKLFSLNNQQLLFSLIFLNSFFISAQENPPIPIAVEVNTSQFLNFGAFTVGTSGGSLTVDYDGNHVATGEIIPLNLGPTRSPALFDLTANPGTIIQINAPTNVELTGSSGGTIYLDIDSFSTGQTFITTASPPGTNPIYVGGTLRIDSEVSAPPGKYQGTFTLTFIHQ